MGEDDEHGGTVVGDLLHLGMALHTRGLMDHGYIDHHWEVAGNWVFGPGDTPLEYMGFWHIWDLTGTFFVEETFVRGYLDY